MADLVCDYSPDGNASAAFSEDRAYRYTLNRNWDDGRTLAWVMLNPSTADALTDDPTIRRCVGFAKAWGYAGITVVNLFAVRSPDPAILARHPDPVGPDNDRVIELLVTEGQVTDFVAAWGAHPFARARAEKVTALLADCGARVDCLGRTNAGHPRHPLYVHAAQAAEPYLIRGAA